MQKTCFSPFCFSHIDNGLRIPNDIDELVLVVLEQNEQTHKKVTLVDIYFIQFIPVGNSFNHLQM